MIAPNLWPESDADAFRLITGSHYNLDGPVGIYMAPDFVPALK